MDTDHGGVVRLGHWTRLPSATVTPLRDDARSHVELSEDPAVPISVMIGLSLNRFKIWFFSLLMNYYFLTGKEKKEGRMMVLVLNF